MRILETIAQSLKTQAIHPTNVLNALINLENNAGIGSLADLEYRLARLVRAMRERQDPATNIAIAWLDSTRAYLEQYGQVAPILAAPRPMNIREKVLRFSRQPVFQTKLLAHSS